MLEFITEPIPWYVAGPIIGLTLPFLLFIGNKTFGISSSFQHMCAAVLPKKYPYFNYDWKNKGKWHLQLAFGVTIGGAIAALTFAEDYRISLADETISFLSGLGITNFSGYVPVELFSWSVLGTIEGIILLILGGFLIGFGTRYAGGCTSGHAITGLATLQKASLIAVIGFFAGGLLATYFILPNILG